MTTRRTGLRERKKQATHEALRRAALQLAVQHGPDRVRVDDIAAAAGVSPRTYNNYFSSREQAIVAAITAEREARVASAVAARPPDVRLADAVADAIVEQYTDPGEDGRDALLLITTSPVLRDAFVGATATLEGPLAGAIAARIAMGGGGGEAHGREEAHGGDGAAAGVAGTGGGDEAAEAHGAGRTAEASGTEGAGGAEGAGSPGGAEGAREATARVLAAGVAAAVRIALEQWLQPAPGAPPTDADRRAETGDGKHAATHADRHAAIDADRHAATDGLRMATGGLHLVSGSLPDLLRTTLAPLAPALDAAEDRVRHHPRHHPR